MPEKSAKQQNGSAVKELIQALNEDLAREYQAIIAYTVYSNVLSGAQWMNIAAELKLHAAQELQHALIIADHLAEAGEDLRQGGRDDPVRPGQRNGDHPELPAPRQAGGSLGALRAGR